VVIGHTVFTAYRPSLQLYMAFIMHEP